MAKPDGRLTAEEVATIKKQVRSGMLPYPIPETLDLCESHEKYRALCQEFVDIYAGVWTQKLGEDSTEVALFSLWLRIVGTPPPKV